MKYDNSWGMLYKTIFICTFRTLGDCYLQESMLPRVDYLHNSSCEDSKQSEQRSSSWHVHNKTCHQQLKRYSIAKDVHDLTTRMLNPSKCVQLAWLTSQQVIDLTQARVRGGHEIKVKMVSLASSCVWNSEYNVGSVVALRSVSLLKTRKWMVIVTVPQTAIIGSYAIVHMNGNDKIEMFIQPIQN